MSLKQNDQYNEYAKDFLIDQGCMCEYGCDYPDYLCEKCEFCADKNEGHNEALMLEEDLQGAIL